MHSWHSKFESFKTVFENKGINIPVYLLRLLWCRYQNPSVCVKWKDKESDYFILINGVRQGDLLSSVCFNIYGCTACYIYSLWTLNLKYYYYYYYYYVPLVTARYLVTD